MSLVVTLRIENEWVLGYKQNWKESLEPCAQIFEQREELWKESC